MGQSDIDRLKIPLGRLVTGEPSATIPQLRALIQKSKPLKITTVGDVVSRETTTAGIQVNLRIIDQRTLRKRIDPFEFGAEQTYTVKNPAGVITREAWDAIREALRHSNALVVVDGEEDLLAIPAILESPDDSFVVYGQPSQGIVVVTVSREVRREVREIANRMTEE